MIIAGMVVYYLLAAGALALVIWHAVRQNVKDATVAYDRLREDLARWEQTPPMPEPLPDKRLIDETATIRVLSISYLGEAATLAIAPLLMQVVRKYLDKPTEREQLIDSLEGVLERPDELHRE